VALLATACAGADDPGAGASGSPSAVSSASTGPAVASACSDGVKVVPTGSPESEQLLTAIVLSTVSKDGAIEVVDSWDRQEDSGVKAAKGATAEQQAIVDDLLASGLMSATSAPRLADPAELLLGKEKGSYIQYSYTTRTVETATASCTDGSSPVEVTGTSFKVVETGLANCTDTPDPVAEYIASEAISKYCTRG
jgi:hypothetical protein